MTLIDQARLDRAEAVTPTIVGTLVLRGTRVPHPSSCPICTVMPPRGSGAASRWCASRDDHGASAPMTGLRCAAFGGDSE